MTSSADEIYRNGLSAMQAGNADAAEALFRQTIEMQPEHMGALNVYGILLAQRGRLEEAEQNLERAVKAGGNSEVTFFNYGLVLRAQKKPLEALEQFSKALALNDSVAQTWNGRGATFIDLDRYQDAVADFDRAIAIEPNFADAHFNKGRALAELRHYAAALASFDQAIALRPQFAPAWVGRGYALHGTGRGDEAFAAFKRAMAMDARLPGAWDGRGKILLDRNLSSEALSDFDKAIELQPDYAEAWLSRGRALIELDRYQEALAAFDRALSLKPVALAYTNMAYVLADLGRLDESMKAVRKAIELDPGFTGNYFMVAEAKRFSPGDPDLAAMEALYAGANMLSPIERIWLDFALGKAYRDTKDYRRSIEHLLAANSAKRSTIEYDEAAEVKRVNQIERAFSRDLLAAKTGLGDPSRRPIFVLGMPRSGSTLVEQILASHPDVESAGELTAFGAIAGSYLELPMTLDQPAIKIMAEQYLARLTSLVPGARHAIDKLPGNFYYVGLIHIIFPNATVIHTLRDPVDTCLSCFTSLFKTGNYYIYDLGELGRAYSRYRHLMEHWRHILPQDRMLDVQYEDVITDLEGQARRIIAHCGLPWDNKCLDFYRTQRQVRTASRTQVRQPVYTSAIGRWQGYEELLTPLLVELGISADRKS